VADDICRPYRSHFLRHVNGRLHTTHIFEGRFSFFTPRVIFVLPPRAATATPPPPPSPPPPSLPPPPPPPPTAVLPMPSPTRARALPGARIVFDRAATLRTSRRNRAAPAADDDAALNELTRTAAAPTILPINMDACAQRCGAGHGHRGTCVERKSADAAVTRTWHFI